LLNAAFIHTKINKNFVTLGAVPTS